MERAPFLTVIIPTAPYHMAVADEAAASAAAQSFPVQIIRVVDADQRGAGYARNQGLAQVATPFVTFLDADDLLDPAFAERTLAAYDGAHYIYTDWWQDDERVRAPERAWVNQTWHCVTALVPTAWARFVGGFDETLHGGEDTDFYMKLRAHGLCGKRLAEPLMHYRRGGKRSQMFAGTAQFEAFPALMTQRYGVKLMGCCGEYDPGPAAAVNERGVGAVLVQAIWGGNRQQRGSVTGTLYPRAGNGALMWVDARDVEAAPHLWQKAVETPPAVDEFQAFASGLLGGGTETRPAPLAPRINRLDEPVQPDIFRLLELYKAARHG